MGITGQTVATQDIPTEPGLYWASCNVKGQYDSVLRVFGEPPFLKTEITELPIAVEVGTPMHLGGYRSLRAVGPKFVIPALDDT